jgi:hypothetical protein
MINEKWDFYSHHIEWMIEDYLNMSNRNEELKNHVYDFIQECINRSLHNLTFDEIYDLTLKLNQ